MKKSSLAVAALCAVAGTAHAQSHVTLYGVLDEGINFISNVDNGQAWELAGGLLQGNRWGLKATEDLGGGMKAVFQLENGFNLSTGAMGQGGRMFGRQAYAGLKINNVGTITMGRQYDSVVDFVAPNTANGNWAGALFSHPFDNDNTGNSFRINNSIKYTSPNYNGLTYGGVYGFSNTAGAFAVNRAMSVGAGYANGPLQFGLAYMNIDNAGASAAGALAPGEAFLAARRHQVFGAGVTYMLGAAKLALAYTHSKFDDPAAGAFSTATLLGGASAMKFDNFEINATYNITPRVIVGGMYTHTRGKLTAGGTSVKPSWNQFGLMADYLLSKRTDVYVQGVYQKISNASTGTFLDKAHIGGMSGSSSEDKQFVARVGLRHRF